MRRKVFINALPSDSFQYSELKTALEQKNFELIITRFEHTQMPKIIKSAEGCCAIISNGEPWDQKAIDAVKSSVRIFVQHGVGVNSLNVPYLTKCGIPLYNVGDANSAEVAEIALFHILNVLRKICFSVKKVNEGCAGNIGLFFGHGLDGKTVGLVGAGNIARNLARMLSGFQTRVLAYDPYISVETAQASGITLVNCVEELFEQSDIVSLHLPLTEETRNSIGKRLFDRMKRGSYIINTSRGAVVNEPELIEAIHSGQLAGAGLDVTAHEPIRPDDPLLMLENVTVTPHIGANSYEAIQKYTRVISNTIENWFHGTPSPGVLNPQYNKLTERNDEQ